MTTSPDSAAATLTARADAVCCRRPMSVIEVTSPVSSQAAHLALYTCSACGRHVWEREGDVLDRDSVLGLVRDRVAEGPAPRAPRQRKAKPARPAVPAPRSAPDLDLREKMQRFAVHGR